MADITIRGRKIVVRELTVQQIRDWFKELEEMEKEGKESIADETLFPDANLHDFRVMTDLTDEELGGFVPSELESVLEKMKEVNSRFFDQRRRLIASVRRIDAPSTQPGA